MLKYKTRDQKSLYFETYIAQIQLDELSHVDQEVFIYQNQESDLFCAQTHFFSVCSLTLTAFSSSGVLIF